MRSVSGLLIVSLLVSSVAPAAPRELQVAQTPAGVGLDLLKREAELKNYFEGCNNYISDTLTRLDLEKDAGDRPSPIRIMGMGIETDASPNVPFTAEQQSEVQDDVGARRLLTGVYVQGLMNAETAWIRMQTQYLGMNVDPAAATAKICSLGAGCSPRAHAIVRATAESAVAEAQTMRRYSIEQAAEVINAGVKRLNSELEQLKFKPRYSFSQTVSSLKPLLDLKVPDVKIGLQEKPTPFKLGNYTREYYELTSHEGPMRLIAIPSLLERIGRLQTQKHNRGLEEVWAEYVDPRDGKRYPARYSNGYGMEVRDHRLKNDGLIPLNENKYSMMVPHGEVVPAEVSKAVREGVELLEQLMSDLHTAVSPQATLSHRAIQSGITKIIGGTGLAAHQVLLTEPGLKASACRAFKDFAIHHAENHKYDRYKNNAMLATGIVVAVIGLVVNFMEAPAIAIITEAVGATAINVVSMGVAAGLVYVAYNDVGKTSRKLNFNVASVLAENEAAEIIISRIPEQVDAAAAARKDLFISMGSGLVSVVLIARDVKLLIDAQKAGSIFHAVRDPEAKANLAKVIAFGTGKVLVKTAKFAPVIRKAMAYGDFKDLQGTIIDYEQDPGSGIMIKARADLFDGKRGFVKLTVLAMTGPNNRPIPYNVKSIELPVDQFQKIVDGIL